MKIDNSKDDLQQNNEVNNKWHGDNPLLCKKITTTICHTMKGEELISNLKNDSKSNSNLYSMWELSQIYRNQEQMDEYIYWLKQIYAHGWQYAELLRMEKDGSLYGQETINRLNNEAYIWSEVLIPAMDELGTFYLSKGDVKSINNAIHTFRYIDCYYYDSASKIKDANKLLKKLNNSSNNYYDISYEDEIGQDAWNKLSDTTQIYIHTSEVVFKELAKLKNDEKERIDFSCVILPLMKALEFELKLIFSYKYLEYLKKDVKSSDNYCNKNNLEPFLLSREWALYENNNEYLFKISDIFPLSDKDNNIPPKSIAQFTLGKVAYIIGRKKIKDKTIFYQTAIDFCESLGIGKPTKWLKYISESIDLLINQRNSSAHAGKIGTIMDVSYCLEKTLTINKLIRNIIIPNF